MPARGPRSIRADLLTLIFGVALPLFGVLGWGFWEQLDRERRDSRDLALRIAQSIASDLRDSNRRSEALLERMAQRPKVRAAVPGDCDSLFPVIDFFPQYLDLEFYDVRGSLLCSAVPQPADAPLSEVAHRWIQGRLASGAKLTGDPAILPIRGKWVSVVFREVEDEARKRSGTLVLQQYVDFNIDAYPPGTVVSIVDDAGNVIARSLDAEKWVGRNVREAMIVQLPLEEGTIERRGLDGKIRQYGFTRVPGTRWRLFVGINSAVATASVRSLLIRGVFVGLVVLLGVLALGLRLSRSIERPLDSLAAAARRIEDAGYSATVPVGGPRELVVVSEAFNRMVARRAEAEAALVASRQQLESLSERLLDVQEEERGRIAREVHDELGQLLTALKMDVGGLLARLPDSTGLEPMIERIRMALDQTVSSVHRIAAELRPPVLTDFGFLAALESEIRAFEARTGIECELSIPDEPLPLPAAVETAAYRIFQEAMTNVARHANATRVEIRLKEEGGEIHLEIHDDGIGAFADDLRSRDRLGVAGMRERARQIGGSVEVTGVAGTGTTVSLRIPSPQEESPS